jgi:hypothetical protein
MKELKICVERAVRPVRASSRHKDRMREELLAHLQELYNEELARLGDPSAALEQAARRFGDPAELRGELQQSVPLMERWLFVPVGPPSFQRFERRLSRPREHESALRVALRQAGWIAVVTGIMFVPLWISRVVFGWPQRSRPAGDAAFMNIGILTLTLAPVLTLLLNLLICGMYEALQGQREGRRFAGKIVARGLLAALSVFAAGLGYGVLLSKHMQFGLPWLWGLAAVSLVTPLLLALFARVRVTEIRRYREWESLEIEQ